MADENQAFAVTSRHQPDSPDGKVVDYLLTDDNVKRAREDPTDP
jgi:hypothetical protein